MRQRNDAREIAASHNKGDSTMNYVLKLFWIPLRWCGFHVGFGLRRGWEAAAPPSAIPIAVPKWNAR